MDNKEVARRVTEDPWQGKLDEVIDLVSEEYTGRVPASPVPILGKEGFRNYVNTYLTAFPDGSITVDHQIGEGPYVVTRWTGRGTNTGELMGISPTGKQVTVEGISFSRIIDGKLHESYIVFDMLALMQQLGAIPEITAITT